MSHVEELIDNLLRAESKLDYAELSYLDADTSIDKRRADEALEAAVLAQFEADKALEYELDEAFEPTRETYPLHVCTMSMTPLYEDGDEVESDLFIDYVDEYAGKAWPLDRKAAMRCIVR